MPIIKVYVTERLKKWIEFRAMKENRSVSNYCKTGIKQYLNKKVRNDVMNNTDPKECTND